MARRVEPDPAGWWERYGHRLHVGSGAGGTVIGAGGTSAGASGANGTGADGAHGVRTAGELTDDMIVRRRADVPGEGWRQVVHRVSGGLVNPGPSELERVRRQLVHRLRRPLHATHRIAVTSIKGGVGKTTVATCLGLALAEHRGDRVVVLDANPDAGTLADRLTGESSVTVRELLRDARPASTPGPTSPATPASPGRLQVLASEQDPAASDAFSRDGVRARSCALLALLQHRHHRLRHRAGALGDGGHADLADSVVIVGAPTVDGASRASKTLDWLLAHGHPELASAAIVVLSCDRTSDEVDGVRIREHFAGPAAAPSSRSRTTRTWPPAAGSSWPGCARDPRRVPGAGRADRGRVRRPPPRRARARR